MRVNQWTTNIQPTWNVNQVRQALFDSQMGNFSRATKLVIGMMADDELPSSCNRAIDLITGAPFTLTPTEEDNASTQAQIDFLTPIWDQAFPEEEMFKMVYWYLWLGVGIGTLDWTMQNGTWMPRLRALSPEFLWYEPNVFNEKTGMYGIWWYQAREGLVQVTPGDGKWVMFHDGTESYLNSSVRALAQSWLIKQYAWRDWTRYNERHGMPLVKAMVPAVSSEAAQNTFWNDIQELGTDSTIMLPSHLDDEGKNVSFDVDLVEAKDNSFDTFKLTIERCDRKFQVHWLGTNSGAELIGSAGSKATSESGRDIAREVADMRARRIAPEIREQMLWPLVSLNMAGAQLIDSPYPSYQIKQGEDAKDLGEGWDAMAKSVQSWQGAGYEITNLEQLASEAGLQLEKIEMPEEPVVPEGTEEPEEPDEEDEEELAQLARSAGTQRTVDGIAAKYGADGQPVLINEAQKLLSIINTASTPQEARDRIINEYGDQGPEELTRLLSQSFELGAIIGKSNRRDL